jgi:hypothetical protein
MDLVLDRQISYCIAHSAAILAQYCFLVSYQIPQSFDLVLFLRYEFDDFLVCRQPLLVP